MINNPADTDITTAKILPNADSFAIKLAVRDALKHTGGRQTAERWIRQTLRETDRNMLIRHAERFGISVKAINYDPNGVDDREAANHLTHAERSYREAMEHLAAAGTLLATAAMHYGAIDQNAAGDACTSMATEVRDLFETTAIGS